MEGARNVDGVELLYQLESVYLYPSFMRDINRLLLGLSHFGMRLSVTCGQRQFLIQQSFEVTPVV